MHEKISQWYFKLFNSIKSEHEAEEFARLELNSLFGQVEPIRNFVDKLMESPLKEFTKEPFRIQDIITMELPYGMIQGYYGTRSDFLTASELVKRLAYTREIFLLVESAEEPSELLKRVFPDGKVGKNVQIFRENSYVLFRFITNQYFLEKSEYISKLSRNEAEVDRNIDILFSYLIKNYYRIPASSTLSIGKRLEDYFAIREELSLYLNHYMHPYKGKFHPKMVRALLNYIFPEEKGTVLDNFAGSGTLLVEAGYLGLNSLGVEINPLSVLMSNVKCHSIKIPSDKLRSAIVDYIRMVKMEILYFEKTCSGQTLLSKSSLDQMKVKEEAKQAVREMNKMNIEIEALAVEKIIIARELLRNFEDDAIREFLLLSPQLISLKLVNSMEELEGDMMGNPRINYDKKELIKLVWDSANDPLKMSDSNSCT